MGRSAERTPGAAIFPARTGARCLSVAAALVLAVAVVYAPVREHAFLSYDDGSYVLENPEVTAGLSGKGFLWAFGYHAGNWHPLTWLSHMLDAQLFGLWAGGHHLVSVGLHAVTAVLLLLLLNAMTGMFWRSTAVAGLFALHPLRVESVAWVAERKDVLSGLLWILTMLAYVRYARRRDVGSYLTTLALFSLGLAAKPMLVTLPLVLLLVDWWPLGRALPPGAQAGASGRPAVPWPRLVLEKTPFLLLSLGSSLVTLWGQTHDRPPMIHAALPLRLENAVLSYWSYLGDVVWPNRLAAHYPFPTAIPWGVVALAAAALAATSLAVLALGQRRPFLPAGWLWYLGTLVPVLGLVQVGGQARADRYTYLTTLGILVAFVWLVAERWPRRPLPRLSLVAACLAVLASLAVASRAYVAVWRDDLALYGHTVRATRDNYLMMNNLAVALVRAGRTEEALGFLQEALRVNPEHCNAQYNLGKTLFILHRYGEAVAPYRRSLECYARERINPPFPEDTWRDLGESFLRVGQYAAAERCFRTLLQLNLKHPEAYRLLAEALEKQGKDVGGHRSAASGN